MMSRGGKKVQVYEFRTSTQQHKVDIKLDTQTGEFKASLGSDIFSSKDLIALKSLVLEAAKKADDTKFERYIAYRVQGGLDDGPYNVTGKNAVGVECYVLLLSGGADERGKIVPGSRFMRRADISASGEFVEYQEESRRYSARYSGEKFIAYTPERWAALCSIQDAIRLLASKLKKTLEEGTLEEREASFSKLMSFGQKMLPGSADLSEIVESEPRSTS